MGFPRVSLNIWGAGTSVLILCSDPERSDGPGPGLADCGGFPGSAVAPPLEWNVPRYLPQTDAPEWNRSQKSTATACCWRPACEAARSVCLSWSDTAPSVHPERTGFQDAKLLSSVPCCQRLRLRARPCALDSRSPSAQSQCNFHRSSRTGADILSCPLLVHAV